MVTFILKPASNRTAPLPHSEVITKRICAGKVKEGLKEKTIGDIVCS